MEDAHIALMRVPKGSPPSSKEIAVARISAFERHPNHRNTHQHNTARTKVPLGDSNSPNITALAGANYLGWVSEEPPSASGDGFPYPFARVRSSTYSAGDSEEESLPHPPTNVIVLPPVPAAAAAARGDGKMEVDGDRSAVAGSSGNGKGRSAKGGDNGGGPSTAVAGWKAVDLLEDAALFGVFDGHGGKAVAEFCRDRLPGKCARRRGWRK